MVPSRTGEIAVCVAYLYRCACASGGVLATGWRLRFVAAEYVRECVLDDGETPWYVVVVGLESELVFVFFSNVNRNRNHTNSVSSVVQTILSAAQSENAISMAVGCACVCVCNWLHRNAFVLSPVSTIYGVVGCGCCNAFVAANSHKCIYPLTKMNEWHLLRVDYPLSNSLYPFFHFTRVHHVDIQCASTCSGVSMMHTSSCNTHSN